MFKTFSNFVSDIFQNREEIIDLDIFNVLLYKCKKCVLNEDNIVDSTTWENDLRDLDIFNVLPNKRKKCFLNEDNIVASNTWESDRVTSKLLSNFLENKDDCPKSLQDCCQKSKENINDNIVMFDFELSTKRFDFLLSFAKKYFLFSPELVNQFTANFINLKRFYESCLLENPGELLLDYDIYFAEVKKNIFIVIFELIDADKYVSQLGEVLEPFLDFAPADIRNEHVIVAQAIRGSDFQLGNNSNMGVKNLKHITKKIRKLEPGKVMRNLITILENSASTVERLDNSYSIHENAFRNKCKKKIPKKRKRRLVEVI